MIAIEAPSAAQFSEQELAAWRGMLQVHARVTQALDSQMRAEHGILVSSYEVLEVPNEVAGCEESLRLGTRWVRLACARAAGTSAAATTPRGVTPPATFRRPGIRSSAPLSPESTGAGATPAS